MTQTPREDRELPASGRHAPPPDSWPAPHAPDGKADPGLDGPWEPRGTRERSFPVPWRWWDAVMIYVLAFMVAVLITVPLVLLAREDLVMPLSIAIQGGLMLLTTLGWIALRHRGHVGRLLGPVPARAGDVLVGLVGGVAGFLLFNVAVGSLLTLLAEALGIEVPQVQQALRDFIQDPRIGWLAVGVAVLLAPLGEELLFRGVLFQSLRNRMSLWPAIVISSIAFGVVHYEPLLIVLTTMVGGLFAWLFHLRGSLVTPIVAHAVYNGISVTILLVTAGS